ncbi:hypothetical protein MTO96_049293 [Rhipicephalus appendiculatus]
MKAEKIYHIDAAAVTSIDDLPLVFAKEQEEAVDDQPQPSTSAVEFVHEETTDTADNDAPVNIEVVMADIGIQVDTVNTTRRQPLSISNVRDSKALNVLTGVPCPELFYNLCDLYTDSRMLMQSKNFCISNEDVVLLSLIKLRHNLPFSFLGVFFGIHRTTASNIFKSTVTVLGEILSKAVFWPTKEAVVDNLTVYFKDYPNLRAVLNCTEIPLQRPKDMESQLLTYSWYKGTYTAKVLVSETPDGHISYDRRDCRACCHKASVGGVKNPQAFQPLCSCSARVRDLVYTKEERLPVHSSLSLELCFQNLAQPPAVAERRGETTKQQNNVLWEDALSNAER